MEKIIEYKKGEEYEADSMKGEFAMWLTMVGQDYDYELYEGSPINILRDFTITISLTYKPELT